MALTISRVIMGANIAGIYGAQIYRSEDKPRYRQAFTLCIAVLAFGTLCAIIRKVDEILLRRKNATAIVTDSQSESEAYESLRAVPPSDMQPVPAIVASDGVENTTTTGTITQNAARRTSVH